MIIVLGTLCSDPKHSRAVPRSRLSPSDKWRRRRTDDGMDKGSMFFNPLRLREDGREGRNVETADF